MAPKAAAAAALLVAAGAAQMMDPQLLTPLAQTLGQALKGLRQVKAATAKYE